MEKAKLLVKKNKKGKFYAEIQRSSGSTQAASFYQPDNDKLNNKDIELEFQNGQVIKMVCEGTVLYDKTNRHQPVIQQPSNTQFNRNSPQTGSSQSNRGHQQADNSQKQSVKKNSQFSDYNLPQGSAVAPYNFIPIQKESELATVKELPLFQSIDTKRKTGHIELTIESKTPIYIRDTYTNEEDRKKKEELKDNSNFFSPFGENQFAIPGSSMRGLVRSIVEVVSFGTMGSIDSKRLYFRALADRTNLRSVYGDEMASYDRHTKSSQYKMKAGVLRKKGKFLYEIVPCGGYREKNGFRQISKREAKDMCKSKGFTYKEFAFYDFGNEYLVVSGGMMNKKNDWLVTKPSASAKPIEFNKNQDEEQPDIQDYIEDKTRFF